MSNLTNMGSRRRLCIIAMGVLIVVVTARVWIAMNSEQPSRQISSVSSFLSSAPADSFAKVERGKVFVFPDDHAAHPSFRQEWWYFTGNLMTPEEDLLGYQLTFFRFSNAPHEPQLESNWQTHSTWMAHFTVTDVGGNQFFYAEDFSRGAIDLSGSQAKPFKVWVNDWSVVEFEDPCTQCFSARVKARMNDFAIDFTIRAESPPVLQGDAGYSEKSHDGMIASYYYSYPSLQTEGSVRIKNDTHTVTGTSWMDREWSSAILAKGQSGWDWFALHLNPTTRLMVFQVRDRERESYRTAHLMSDDKENQKINSNYLTMRPTAWWQSPTSVASYPIKWQLISNHPDANFELEVFPQIKNQELDLAFRYYEGAVFVSGSLDGEEIEGQGYMELTGYGE